MAVHTRNQPGSALLYSGEDNHKGPGMKVIISARESTSMNETASPCEDPLVDMKYLVYHSGLSDKYFYSIIKRGMFPKPIKLGRSSRWRKSEYEKWVTERIAAR